MTKSHFMRNTLILILLILAVISYGQQNTQISTIDFVQILNDNNEEAIYYYQNNWTELRERAMNKGIIHSYQLLEVPATQDAPFHLMLITTYANENQFDLREEGFSRLIEEHGQLKLLNGKTPDEFRKTVFNKNTVRQWN